jgi:hypothetical protein
VTQMNRNARQPTLPRSRAVATVAVAFATASGGCFASSSGGGTPDASFTPDGESFDSQANETGPEDAAVADATMEASAQDSSTGPAPEAAADTSVPVDAGIDAPPDAPADAGSISIGVVVVNRNGLEPGIPIVWSDATGATVDQSTTDSSGAATTTNPAATTVTAVMGGAFQPYLYTETGLTNGQVVYVADEVTIVNDARTYTITVPSFPPISTIDSGTPSEYDIFLGGTFTGGTPPLHVPLQIDQQGDVGMRLTGSTPDVVVPIVVQAFDSNANFLAYASSTWPLASTPDGGAYTVNLPNAWDMNISQQSFIVDTGDAGLIPSTAYNEVASGVLIPPPTYTVGAGKVVYTQPDFAQSIQVEASFSITPTSGFAGVSIAAMAPEPTAAGTLMLDASGIAAAPTIASALQSYATAGAPTVTWTMQNGTLSSATAIVAIARWTTTPFDGGTQYGSWTIVTPPPSAASITGPALPASLGQYLPTAQSTPYSMQLLGVVGQTAFPTYASFVPAASVLQWVTTGAPAYAPFLPPLAGTGTVLVTGWSTQ